jgi:hypothetical protein
MAKRITVSFKEENDKEEKILNHILSHSNYSGYVKDVVWKDIQEKEHLKKRN